MCVHFLTKQYTAPRSKASSIFNIRLKIFPYVFRPSFVISKIVSNMSFDISEKEITDCVLCVHIHSDFLFLKKEVIQPHLPVRLPCYDFTPLTKRTFGMVLLAVRLTTSGTPHSDGVTGGVYKARERIHRTVLMCDY